MAVVAGGGGGGGTARAGARYGSGFGIVVAGGALAPVAGM
jgi:hypothetical protein